MQDSDETYFLETDSDEKRAFNNGMKICGQSTKIATDPKFDNVRPMGDASKGYVHQASQSLIFQINDRQNGIRMKFETYPIKKPFFV